MFNKRLVFLFNSDLFVITKKSGAIEAEVTTIPVAFLGIFSYLAPILV